MIFTDLERDTIPRLLDDPLNEALHHAVADRIVEECGEDGSSPRRTLISLVCRYPTSNAPRLAFACWCAANGEPERAEFTRVQCELASPRCRKPVYRQLYNHDLYGNMPVDAVCEACQRCDLCRQIPVLQQRERELWRNSGDKGWWDTVPGSYRSTLDRDTQISTAEGWIFVVRRGFVSSLTCSAADFLQHGDYVVSEHPVERVAMPTGMAYGVYKDLRVEGGSWDIRDRDGALAYLKAMWPAIEFDLPPTENGTVNWDNLADWPAGDGDITDALNAAPDMIASAVQQMAEREMAAEQEVIRHLTVEYRNCEPILARRSSPGGGDFPPSVECNQCGVRTGFREEFFATDGPVAGFRVFVAPCAGCRRVYVGVIPRHIN